MIEVFRPENVLVPQECVSHKNSVQFYFPGLQLFYSEYSDKLIILSPNGYNDIYINIYDF